MSDWADRAQEGEEDDWAEQRRQRDGVGEVPTFHSTLVAKYDPETGDLSYIDELTTRVIEVRAQFEEGALTQAVIEEMKRKGYLVVAPGETVIATPGIYLMMDEERQLFVDRRSDRDAVERLAAALNDYLRKLG